MHVMGVKQCGVVSPPPCIPGQPGMLQNPVGQDALHLSHPSAVLKCMGRIERPSLPSRSNLRPSSPSIAFENIAAGFREYEVGRAAPAKMIEEFYASHIKNAVDASVINVRHSKQPKARPRRARNGLNPH
jgi:hypothetical protein